jgi:hypothetical protein
MIAIQSSLRLVDGEYSEPGALKKDLEPTKPPSLDPSPQGGGGFWIGSYIDQRNLNAKSPIVELASLSLP